MQTEHPGPADLQTQQAQHELSVDIELMLCLLGLQISRPCILNLHLPMLPCGLIQACAFHAEQFDSA